ncbi:reverse transcriptase domain-containing protein, partial [Tanacetum coccineum]
KIARPMTHLLEKETPFVFSEECIDSFNTLKRKLTEAPILIAPDWDLPFELMCDASDFAIGAVLGQRKNKHFQPIHYASKTMNEAQTHYTTTEKELLAVVYVWICQKSQEISQKRTRERMSDQEAKEIKAKAREIMPQPSTFNLTYPPHHATSLIRLDTPTKSSAYKERERIEGGQDEREKKDREEGGLIPSWNLMALWNQMCFNAVGSAYRLVLLLMIISAAYVPPLFINFICQLFQSIRRKTPHSQLVDKKFNSFSAKSFSKDVRQLIFRFDKVKVRSTILNYAP